MYKKEPERVYKYNDAEDSELTEILDPKHTALLMIDMQNDFCSVDGVFAKGGRNCKPILDIVPSCKKLLESARDVGVFVVHIQQSTLPDGQSDNGGWLAFKTRDGKAPSYSLVGSWGWKHLSELAPITEEDSAEPIVMKFRPDAFLHTQLDMILRSNGIKTVVCCGCNTEGCVLATVMGSAFHDYYTCVAEDAVATSVDGAHERAMWLMKKRYLVRPVETIVTRWNEKTIYRRQIDEKQ